MDDQNDVHIPASMNAVELKEKQSVSGNHAEPIRSAQRVAVNISGDRLIISSVFLLLFIDGLGVSLVFPLLTNLFLSPVAVIVSVHASPAWRSILYGAGLISFSLGMFLGAPLVGKLSDSWGRKKALILTVVGITLGYIISAVGICLISPPLFIIGRLLGGISSGNVPVSQAIISDISSSQNRAGNLALVTFAMTAGYAIGPIWSDLVSKSTSLGLSLPFFLVAGITIPNIFLISRLPETQAASSSAKGTVDAHSEKLRWWDKIEGLRGFMGAFFLFQAAWTLYFQYLPPLLSSTPLQNHVGLVISCIGAGMTLSLCMLVRILQRTLTPLGGILTALPTIIISWGVQVIAPVNLPIFCITSVTAGVGYGIGYAFFLTLLSDRARADIKGLVLGGAASLSALSSVCTAMLGSLAVCWHLKGALLFSLGGALLCGIWLAWVFAQQAVTSSGGSHGA